MTLPWPSALRTPLLAAALASLLAPRSGRAAEHTHSSGASRAVQPADATSAPSTSSAPSTAPGAPALEIVPPSPSALPPRAGAPAPVVAPTAHEASDPSAAAALAAGSASASSGSLDLRSRPARSGVARLTVPIAETMATTLVILEWNRWVGQAPWADVTPGSVRRNLDSRWVLDHDDFWVNQVGHPYQGTWSFTAARSSGLGFWASAPFAFGASALWELAGETEPPSINDQVTTTVAGIVLGEVLHRFAGALRAEGGAWREVAAGVLEPMGALNGRLVGPADAQRAPPSRWRLGLGAALPADGAPGQRRPMADTSLSITWGVAGSEGLAIRRPFDHFVLDFDWTAASDPVATVRVRGLVAGTTFEAGPARGLFGAFLSFDFATPPGERISTSALGFGGSAATDLGGGLALEGDAIASVILLGAGGSVPSADGLDRNYRFGPGQQGLLGLRLVYGTRARAEVAVRQYLLLSAESPGGDELIVHGTASAVLRIAGPHGLGIETTRLLRRADVAGDAVRNADSILRVYYTLLGGS